MLRSLLFASRLAMGPRDAIDHLHQREKGRSMNDNQATAAWIGVALFVAMGVYPPWVRSHMVLPTNGNNLFSSNQPVLTSQLIVESTSYSWIWEPPGASYSCRDHDHRIDLARLSVQWLCLVAVFGLWIHRLRTQPKQMTAKS